MSAPQTFAVTWDYRCPFARNGHEHLLDGLAAGAEWDVTFVPYFLNQGMGAEGQDTWDDPAHQADLLALAAGVVVRDRFADHFLAVHRALFDARHVDGARPPGPGRGARRAGRCRRRRRRRAGRGGRRLAGQGHPPGARAVRRRARRVRCPHLHRRTTTPCSSD